jgi:hypothetical protein
VAPARLPYWPHQGLVTCTFFLLERFCWSDISSCRRYALRCVTMARYRCGHQDKQVLKKRLALVSPTLVADAFMYEEGPDLDPDEAAESAAFRPVALAALPGGGIRNGAIVAVSDQAQAFEAQLVVSHRVGHGDFLWNSPHAALCVQRLTSSGWGLVQPAVLSGLSELSVVFILSACTSGTRSVCLTASASVAAEDRSLSRGAAHGAILAETEMSAGAGGLGRGEGARGLPAGGLGARSHCSRCRHITSLQQVCR